MIVIFPTDTNIWRYLNWFKTQLVLCFAVNGLFSDIQHSFRRERTKNTVILKLEMKPICNCYNGCRPNQKYDIRGIGSIVFILLIKYVSNCPNNLCWKRMPLNLFLKRCSSRVIAGTSFIFKIAERFALYFIYTIVYWLVMFVLHHCHVR